MEPALNERATPVDAETFAARMTALGPFERAPVLAVGVSGGADSMALCILAGRWLKRRGGRLIGLTVDHGLRAGSAAEARQVGFWLAARGIEHRILPWRGSKPSSGIPAAARAARYELLSGRCRAAGILHLLLGHHLEDQAETLLLRLGRGSGVDGLAAMAPVTERDGVRLLRPLLGISKARLKATLERARQSWIEDPSNADPGFARTRVRAMLPRLGAEGMTPARLAATAARMARARTALEEATARMLAEAVSVHPAGYCRLELAAFTAAEAEISLRALARIVMCIGGAVYPPRMERLERLHAKLARGGLEAAYTLGGCRIAPHRGGLLVTREAAAAGEAIEARPGGSYRWDGRFQVRLGGRPQGKISSEKSRRRGGYVIRRLGMSGWQEALARDSSLKRSSLPAPARTVLPALFDLEGLLAAPHLNFTRGEGPGIAVRFRPPQPLAGGGFADFG